MQVIEKDDYMFSFDLNLTYLQVKVKENFLKYLGFSTEEGNGRKIYFQYKMLQFRLNVAYCVLMKMLRSLIEKWRKEGIAEWIHVDDGLGCLKGRENVL